MTRAATTGPGSHDAGVRAQRPIGWNGRREGGLRGLHWFTVFVRLTGLWLGPLMLRIFTWGFVPFLKTRRLGSEQFFTHLRGRRASLPVRLLDTYRNFLAFTLCWFERTHAFSHGPAFLRLDSGGADHLERALALGKGAIMLTAHVGNYELGAWILKQSGRPVNLVMADYEAQAVAQYLERLRGDVRPRIIAVNRSPWSSLEVAAALRRGEIVCMQGDRALSPAHALVPFLGKPAPFPTGPYQLAQLTGAPILPVFSSRMGRAHYRFEIFAPLGGPTALEEYVQLLEREVLLRPYYWFNVYSFWDGIGERR